MIAHRVLTPDLPSIPLAMLLMQELFFAEQNWPKEGDWTDRRTHPLRSFFTELI
ncbi:hypothetical protein N9B45_00365 [bacterium]|nr:hypothetical protein [bacterium]